MGRRDVDLYRPMPACPSRMSVAYQLCWFEDILA